MVRLSSSPYLFRLGDMLVRVMMIRKLGLLGHTSKGWASKSQKRNSSSNHLEILIDSWCQKRKGQKQKIKTFKRVNEQRTTLLWLTVSAMREKERGETKELVEE